MISKNIYKKSIFILMSKGTVLIDNFFIACYT